ncbi:leucine Rich repeat-containing domain protein [Dictyocaulus viviparus]|uniref:Leucine Rich repeat-containing domain protein n=1 Tax=Dictyocaulus viviparus TaxID=29172 RepID=A0A0D8XML2_DICVI|nr:leucine Rich repeat-containing domain protein [Dictyocaulus viviparus]
MSVHVVCHRLLTSTVPTLPITNLKTQPAMSIIALSMTGGDLTCIQQDAFRMHNIETLDFSDNQIQTVNVNAFRGLEMKLTRLNLKHNNLSTIPTWALTYLHQLQILRLDGNHISYIRGNAFDETQLNNLHFLHLDNNQIPFIPNMAFAKLRLIVLTLSNNRITHLEKLSLPQSISILELKNNLLTEIPYLALKDKIALQVLDLEGNNISFLSNNPEVSFKNELKVILRNNKIRSLSPTSFESFKKFTELDLSYNKISDIHPKTFESISHVKSLDLSHNTIAYMKRGMFKNLAKNLRQLNLEENIFHALPEALSDLQNLTHLNLNGNKITRLNDALEKTKPELLKLTLAYNRLKFFPPELLIGMTRLKHLDLSKNNIIGLNRSILGTDYDGGTSLKHINLAGNQIRFIGDTNIFLQMTSLTYLDLSYNQIEAIEPKSIGNLLKLEHLYLQNNKLRQFPLHANQNLLNLKQLDLNNNLIKRLPDYALSSTYRLQYFSAAGNQIYSINEKVFHMNHSQALISVDLSRNKISTLSRKTFHALEKLQIIKLNNNMISMIDAMAFSMLPSLRLLDLSNNAIIQILPQALFTLPALGILLLNNNNIEALDKLAFQHIDKIETIDISHNLLKNFSCNQLGSIRTIHNLNLANNRIVETDLICILRSLVRLNIESNFLDTVKKIFIDGADSLSYISLRNNGIFEIHSNTFNCCPKLSIIDLSHNHIRIIQKDTFIHQELLSYLDVSHNALQNIQTGCFGKNNVISLNAAANELERVPTDALQMVSDRLTELDLRSNRIRSLDSSQFFGLRNLTRLDISHNIIETVEEAAFEHLIALEYLDISNNPVSTWSPSVFKDMSNSMNSLNLADTGLFFIPRMNYNTIQYFNLSMNKIYEISRQDMMRTAQLVSLDISFNNIYRLENDVFTDLVSLKTLNISGNPIIEILMQFKPLHQVYNIAPKLQQYEVIKIIQNLPPLRSLYIELREETIDTQLLEIDMSRMRDLTLSGSIINNVSRTTEQHNFEVKAKEGSNPVQGYVFVIFEIHISYTAFHMLRGYRVQLSIRNTSIRELPESLFTTLEDVYFLSLSLHNNRIRSFNPFKNTVQPWINQHGTILESINMAGNPIYCDCSMSWVSEWILLSPIHASDFENTYCENQISKINSLAYRYTNESVLSSQCLHRNEGSTYSIPLFIPIYICFFFNV